MSQPFHHRAFQAQIAATFCGDDLDAGRAARIAAKRHLASLPPERRAQIEREWMEGEAAVQALTAPIKLSPERRAMLQAEWDAPLLAPVVENTSC